MIPARYAMVVVSLITSGVMSFLVSGFATFRALGPAEDFMGIWMTSWVFSWSIAFPTLLLALPIVRRMVGAITRPN